MSPATVELVKVLSPTLAALLAFGASLLNRGKIQELKVELNGKLAEIIKESANAIAHEFKQTVVPEIKQAIIPEIKAEITKKK